MLTNEPGRGPALGRGKSFALDGKSPLPDRPSINRYWFEYTGFIALRLIACTLLFVLFFYIESWMIVPTVAVMSLALGELNQSAFWFAAGKALSLCFANFLIKFKFEKILVKVKRAWWVFMLGRFGNHKHMLPMLADTSKAAQKAQAGWFATIGPGMQRFANAVMNVLFLTPESIAKMIIYGSVLWQIGATYHIGVIALPHAVFFLTLLYSLAINGIGTGLQLWGQGESNKKRLADSAFRRRVFGQGSEQAAAFWQEKEVGRRTFVGLFFDESLDMIIAAIDAFDTMIYSRLFEASLASAWVTIMPWVIAAGAVFSGHLVLATTAVAYQLAWYKFYYNLRSLIAKITALFGSKSDLEQIQSVYDALGGARSLINVSFINNQGNTAREIHFDFTALNGTRYSTDKQDGSEDLTIKLPSQHYILPGDNGSGKSTLYRALSGALQVKEGYVRVKGFKRVVVVPQHPAQPPDWTVWQYLQGGQPRTSGRHKQLLSWIRGIFGKHFWQGSSKLRLSKTDQWFKDKLDQLGFQGQYDKPFNILSAGQRKVLALLRVLGQEYEQRDGRPATLYLLDEFRASVSVDKQGEMESMLKVILGDNDCVLETHHAVQQSQSVSSSSLHVSMYSINADTASLLAKDDSLLWSEDDQIEGLSCLQSVALHHLISGLNHYAGRGKVICVKMNDAIFNGLSLDAQQSIADQIKDKCQHVRNVQWPYPYPSTHSMEAFKGGFKVGGEASAF